MSISGLRPQLKVCHGWRDFRDHDQIKERQRVQSERRGVCILENRCIRREVERLVAKKPRDEYEGEKVDLSLTNLVSNLGRLIATMN